jgi:hypothetical protein
MSNLRAAHSECLDLLDEMNKLINKYAELESVPSGFRDRSRRVWQRLKWNSADVQKLCLRLTANIAFLSAIYGELST